MKIEPYLFFEGRCDEAIEFYRNTLGAEATTIMRYGENPDPGSSPSGSENKVMHANLRIGETTVMVSDGECGGQPSFQGFSLTLTTKSQDEARKWFESLSEGGQIQMPLSKMFFSPLFGMVMDRFGVSWMILTMA